MILQFCLYVFLATLITYILFLTFTEYNPKLISHESIENNQDKLGQVNKEMTIITSNIGFGAHDKDFSFFMDGGKLSRAISKDRVINNITSIGNLLLKENPNFALFQEIDLNSTRSYRVNQYKIYKNIFKNYATSFGINFNVKWMAYPLRKPQGKILAGQGTFSNLKIKLSERVSLPINKTWPYRIFSLKRCALVTRVPIENKKELVIINSHLSAFDRGGIIRKKQLKFVQGYLEDEYAKGNYIIIGSDWNHQMPNTNPFIFKSKEKWPKWLQKMPNDFNPRGFKWFFDKDTPSCRTVAKPYRVGENFKCIVDGFLVSDNIEVTSIHAINLNFVHSDHNPVKLKFKLK